MILRERLGGNAFQIITVRIKKIVSGGQTGVDQAALDFALENGIECGGWCPKGRICEAGKIPVKYPVKETENESYSFRTELNVRSSDGTLIFTKDYITGEGTALTIENCTALQKPYLSIEITDFDRKTKIGFRNWCFKNNVKILNVAGNRESHSPGIKNAVKKLMKILFETKK